jgi:hypothetical protein
MDILLHIEHLRWPVHGYGGEHGGEENNGLEVQRGASMALITYFVIKLVGVAHDNEWGYLATGWGQWFMLELFAGVLLPLGIFAYGIRSERVGIIRLGAFIAVAGIAMNRLNTAIITFNWNLYQEIPHLFEAIIAVTLFAVYIATYRFILYRLPIVYAWKPLPAEARERAAEREGVPGALGQPSAAFGEMTLPD